MMLAVIRFPALSQHLTVSPLQAMDNMARLAHILLHSMQLLEHPFYRRSWRSTPPQPPAQGLSISTCRTRRNNFRRCFRKRNLHPVSRYYYSFSPLSFF
jgi:hypothetical protein